MDACNSSNERAVREFTAYDTTTATARVVLHHALQLQPDVTYEAHFDF